MTDFAIWCSVCASEQAVQEIEIQINGEWISLDVGPDCLTRMEESGKLDM